jgi:hypothetical protein
MKITINWTIHDYFSHQETGLLWHEIYQTTNYYPYRFREGEHVTNRRKLKSNIVTTPLTKELYQDFVNGQITPNAIIHRHMSIKWKFSLLFLMDKLIKTFCKAPALDTFFKPLNDLKFAEWEDITIKLKPSHRSDTGVIFSKINRNSGYSLADYFNEMSYKSFKIEVRRLSHVI